MKNYDPSVVLASLARQLPLCRGAQTADKPLSAVFFCVKSWKKES